MTREEAINILIRLPLLRMCTRDPIDKVSDALNMAIETLEERPHGEWIPCSDRLPEEFKEVLVWYEYYSYKIEKLKQTYGIGYVFQGNWMGDVYGEQARCIAWMPLPEPYKEEGEAE